MNSPRPRRQARFVITEIAVMASSIFLRRIVGVVFMRVNSKCAHQARPPSWRRSVTSVDGRLACGVATETCRPHSPTAASWRTAQLLRSRGVMMRDGRFDTGLIDGTLRAVRRARARGASRVARRVRGTPQPPAHQQQLPDGVHLARRRLEFTTYIATRAVESHSTAAFSGLAERAARPMPFP